MIHARHGHSGVSVLSVRSNQSFLIICEGVNTEPDYFNAFRLTSANIKAVGQGLNTVGLVQKALRMKEEERKKGREYDQCWGGI